MICLHQINSACRSLYSLFPRLCAHIYAYIQRRDRRCSRSSQRWSRCSTRVARPPWFLGARPQRTRAGIRNAAEAKGCGHDVTARRGRSEADVLLKMTYNRFPLASVIGLYYKGFYCVKIGWKLIGACMRQW